MKRKLALLTLVTFFLGGYIWLQIPDFAKQEAFIAKWSRDFRQWKTLEKIGQQRLPLVQKFPSGEWAAIVMEHACCSGAGFNAVVVYDSHGKIRTNTERCFCGYEELDSYVHSINARTLAEFDKQFIPLKERH